MPAPSFMDSGTFNLRDVDNNVLVAKVHVETAEADVAGGRSFVMHWAIAKANAVDNGWGIWSKPTLQANKSWKWEPTTETLAQFLTWMHDGNRKPKLRYMVQSTREQDGVP